MNNTTRYVLAGILVFLIIILQPIYLEWLGYNPDNGAVYNEAVDSAPEESPPAKVVFEKADVSPADIKTPLDSLFTEAFITVSTPLYTATLTNRSGGSFVSYIINDDSANK